MSRYGRIRSGLAVGFPGDGAVGALRSLRGGVWLSESNAEDLPFEDRQFEVVAMAGHAVTRSAVREANRVLKPDGCLFFTVNEKTGKQPGFTPPEIYKIIREGFDIIEMKRPKWWLFGRKGHTLTVCARKKAWREHVGLVRDGAAVFTPFGNRT